MVGGEKGLFSKIIWLRLIVSGRWVGHQIMNSPRRYLAGYVFGNVFSELLARTDNRPNSTFSYWQINWPFRLEHIQIIINKSTIRITVSTRNVLVSPRVF